MIQSPGISLRESGATLSSVSLLTDLIRILRVAPDLEGAFQQAVRLLEERALRQCLGIILLNYKSNRKWVSINRGASPRCILNAEKDTILDQSCWAKEERFAPHIHMKEGKNIVVRNEASLAEVKDLSGVDALCHPIKVGDQMVLSIVIRPLRIDQLVLKEELLLVSAVSMLLKQWIELRFDPLEFIAPAQNQPSITSQANGVPIEEILIHRIGEMITVYATGPPADKSLYNQVIELVEKGMIRWALSRAKLVQTEAAQILGINRNTLRTKMKLYGLFIQK